MEIRIGIGYDSHRFKKGNKLYLGGVEIPFEYGFEGHSDGDILIHALIDALLGAISYMDIGRIFPDSSQEYKDIRSTELLKKTKKILDERKVEIVNIDAVIIIERPKISPYVETMKETIAEILGIDKNKVSIKGKTNEGMGFIGHNEGGASIVVALIEVI